MRGGVLRRPRRPRARQVRRRGEHLHLQGAELTRHQRRVRQPTDRDPQRRVEALGDEIDVPVAFAEKRQDDLARPAVAQPVRLQHLSELFTALRHRLPYLGLLTSL